MKGPSNISVKNNSPGHTVVIAPARTGKLTTSIAPALLSGAIRAALVIDPKAEIAPITIRYRRSLGRAVAINAFNKHADHIGPPARYNPMKAIDPKSTSFCADADNLACSINPMVGKEPHWINTSREVWSGVIQAVRRYMPLEQQNLGTVYSLIAGPLPIFKAFVADAIKEGDHAIVERLSRFDDMSSDDREGRSILSVAKTNGAFLSIEPIRDCLSGSDITAAELREDPTTTLYSIMPPEYAQIGYAFNRLIVESVTRDLMATPGNQVAVLIDEWPQLQRMEVIDTLFAMGAGMNIKLFCYAQDIHQLRALAPESWVSYLSNAATQIWFAPRDKDSADHLASRCGQRTVLVKSSSTREITRKEAKAGFTGISHSYAPQPQPLFLPQQIMALRKDRQLCFVDGLDNVLVTARYPYWAWPELAGRFDPNPWHPGGK
jgi:type IV secretion system protein VirD4